MRRRTTESLWRLLLLGFLFASSLVVLGQEQHPSPSPTISPTPIASPTPMPSPSPSPSPTPVPSPSPVVVAPTAEPLYTNYRGVSIGMSIAEAQEKLGTPKSKGKRQDFFVFSEQESAQIFYLNGKVSAISVDYVGADSGAPTTMDVFGVEVAPGKNGRIYKLVRYRKEGYWVAYNRTPGKTPIVSITMRTMR